MDGCAEHILTLQTLIVDARRKRKQFSVEWLALANAFGSVPYSTSFRALQWFGLSEEAVDTIKYLYEGCTATITTAEGSTEEINLEAGV